MERNNYGVNRVTKETLILIFLRDIKKGGHPSHIFQQGSDGDGHLFTDDCQGHSDDGGDQY